MNEARRGEEILTARGLTKSFQVNRLRLDVLRGVDCRFRRGEKAAIQGASGAGKSTLMHILGCLERPTAGFVHWKDRDIYAMKPDRQADLRSGVFGFVFQAYHLLSELTLLENIFLPALKHWSGRSVARTRAKDLLSRVGLGGRLDHRPYELSGGEQQRAAIARALINDPEIILADEPTGNLDSVSGERVLNLLFELVAEENRTLILVTHDTAVAARCDRVLHLKDGVIV